MVMNVPEFKNIDDGLRYFEHRHFKGLNIVDNEADLQPGQFPDGLNIDPSRELGSLARRLGTTAMFSSLGASEIEGIHNYKYIGGERILFGWNKACYKWAGVESAVVKTTTADFNTVGSVFTDTQAFNNEIIATQSSSGENVAVDNMKSGFAITLLNSGQRVGQEFKTKERQFTISSITVHCKNHDTSSTMLLTLYTSKARTTTLGSKVKTFNLDTHEDIVYTFDSPITVSPETTYYFELTLSSGDYVLIYGTTTEYEDGNAYKDGALLYDADGTGADYFLLFKISQVNFVAEGTYTSEVIDLTATPYFSRLSFNGVQETGTSIGVLVRGGASSAACTSASWVSSGNGYGLPLYRYMQIRFVFASSGTNTYIIKDFTISYETATIGATSIKSGLSGNRIKFVNYRNRCWFAEGGRPQVYNGTAVRNVGIDPPATEPTLATGEAGSLSGVYHAKVTFVLDDGSESQASDASLSVTVSSQKIDWSGIPVGAAGSDVTKRKLYRTKAGGSEYFYVTTLGDNTTTTYDDDNTTDADLVTPLETDNHVPPSSNIISQHNNYMLYVPAGSADRLVISKVGKPEVTSYNASDAIPVGYYGFPGEIKAVKSYREAVIVGGDNFTSVIFGSIMGGEGDNTTIKSISNNVGPLSHESVIECFSAQLGGDVLIFPTYNGLVYLTPGLQEESLRSVPLSRNVQPYFDSAINKENIAAVFFDQRYLIAINYNEPSETSVQYNNAVFSLDMRNLEWSSKWTLNANGFCVSGDSCYMADSQAGKFYKMFSGSTDDGAEYVSSVSLANFMSNRKVQFDHIRLHLKRGSNTIRMLVRYRLDGYENGLVPGVCDDWAGAGGSSRSAQDEIISPDFYLPAFDSYSLGLTIEDMFNDFDWILYAVDGWYWPPQEGVY